MTRGKKNPAENNASSYIRFINLWRRRRMSAVHHAEMKSNKTNKKKSVKVDECWTKILWKSAWKSASKCHLLSLQAGSVLNPKSYINCSKHKSKSARIPFHSSTRTSPACQKVHLCYKVDQLTMLRKPLLSQRYMQSNLWHQCCDTAAAVLDAKRLQFVFCFYTSCFYAQFSLIFTCGLVLFKR